MSGNRYSRNSEWIEKARQRHFNKYSYEKTIYSGSQNKVIITCPKHGDFEQRACSHLSGNGCPKCRISNLQDTTEDFVKKAKAVHGATYDYSKTVFIESRVKVTITCKKHGDFVQRASAHLLGQGCPVCAKNVRRSSLDGFIAKAKSAHGNKYSYENVSSYVNNRYKVKIRCKHCNNIFSVTPKNHTVNKTGCPHCAGRSSRIEEKLAKWLEYKGITVVRRDRSVLDGYELDIYLPSVKVGIEINGLYWHRTMEKGRLYHQQKSEIMFQRGMTLYHFWEHDLNYKFDIVKSMLISKLQLGKRVFAKNTAVRQISSFQANQFFDDTHLSGRAKCSFAVGLFEDDLLVGAMSFVKPRFNKSFEWEISRMSFQMGKVVVGGASKMFNFFKSAVKPVSVISYASLDHGTGEVYLRLGFEWFGVTAPNYFWVRQKTVYSRYQTQKHKLEKLLQNFDPTLTEKQNMQNHGFYQVHNCGNVVYAWFAKV